MCCPESLTTGAASSIDPLDVLTSRRESHIDAVDTAAAVSFTSKAEVVKHLASLHGIQGASSRVFAAVLEQHKLRGTDGLAQKWLYLKGEQHILKTNAYWFRLHQGSGVINREVFLEIHDMAADCETHQAPGQRRKLFPAAKYVEESLQTWQGLVAPEADGESASLSGGSDDRFLDDGEEEEETVGGFFPVRDEEHEKEEEAEMEEMVARVKRRVSSSGRRGSRADGVVNGYDAEGGGGDDEDGDDDEGLENSKDGWGTRGSSSSDGVQSDGEAVQVDSSPDALDLAERRLERVEREKKRRKKERQRHGEMEQGLLAPGGSGAVRRSSTRTRRLRRCDKIRRDDDEEEEDWPQQVRQRRQWLGGGETSQRKTISPGTLVAVSCIPFQSDCKSTSVRAAAIGSNSRFSNSPSCRLAEFLQCASIRAAPAR